ncbi:MAG TPA: peptidase, partial [Pasteurellaceae bacterium]|nr:peptidase [Pasteurellaceae bacterium]
MNLSEQILPWEALQPQLNIPQIPNEPIDFFALQPRARSAIAQFMQNVHRTLLVLKADELTEYASAVENFVKSQQAAELTVSGVQYIIEQADSFSFAKIRIEPAQSNTDNFAAKKSVATALYFDQSQLLGAIRVHPTSHDIELNAGLVHQLNNGVLILSVSALLEHFELWARLKQILLNRTFDWYSAHPFKALPCEIPSYPLSLKVILLGNRADLVTLAELEPDLYSLADYSELDNYFAMEDTEQHLQWAQYVQSFARQNDLAPLTQEGLNRLYQLLVRESEDRTLINISPVKLKEMLSGAELLTENKALTAVDFERYFQQKTCQQGFLREQTYADILHEQIYVETEGEVVGQINGLSVIEYAGTPLSFGEPARMSCIVQFGDGEVIDIERKSELAGNIHGKGIMIAEACLANILDFPSQLPFSASLVFEQSYGEIDGDSASLAAFCVLVSALADLPLPQSIAITGSIDQFGMVHSVGGVNDKIEGFFTICARRGLTGKQGVVIPNAAINQLSLSDEVISAVKNRQFFVWAVDDVFQTCELLFQRDLVDENKHQEKEYSIAQLIMQRI